MINSTKPPASGAGNLNESRLMSQGANFAKSYTPRAASFRSRSGGGASIFCFCSTCNHVTEVGGL